MIGASWQSIDSNQDGQISIKTELTPAYRNYYTSISGLLTTPQFAGWYQSLKALPPFSEIAASMKPTRIHIYLGTEDAQSRWIWSVEDANLLPTKPIIRLFPGLGHCWPLLSRHA